MSRNSNYLGAQRCCYSKTQVTGAQGVPGARGPIGPSGGPTGPTGPRGATGSSLWTTTNAIGPQGVGYTGIGVTGIDVLIGGNLLVTGGIDPTYLALTPQPSGPQGFINPLWLDNNGNLRLDKILLDNTSGDPTQLAITNSATSNIYTFGATGTICQLDSSADNLVLNSGLLILNNIPTSNPGVTGAVWKDSSGFLKIV
jgi:hypothetical protein